MFVTDWKFVVVNPTFKKQLAPNSVSPWTLVRRSVIFVSVVHPENALADILVTVEGIFKL